MMHWITEQGGVTGLWRATLNGDALGLAWLGQAGFALRFSDCRLLIDPYLSNHLANKYRGTEFSHVRMMPTPIAAEQIGELDWVFCSHRHSDHMDPGSLAILANANPRAQFVVPRAEMDFAISIGIPENRLIGVNARDVLQLNETVECRVLASAHEELKSNAHGDHHFLGFVLKSPICTLYHSGDTVVYPGLAEELAALRIDLAMLPVNGRDEFRRSRGIAGNMNLDEATRLCVSANIPVLIPHHFGMFEFNTVSLSELSAAGAMDKPRCIVPDVNHWYQTERSGA
jgi:L-ascorbate metabolism protein UlaG (beta-lactamase superfamily)